MASINPYTSIDALDVPDLSSDDEFEPITISTSFPVVEPVSNITYAHAIVARKERSGVVDDLEGDDDDVIKHVNYVKQRNKKLRHFDMDIDVDRKKLSFLAKVKINTNTNPELVKVPISWRAQTDQRSRPKQWFKRFHVPEGGVVALPGRHKHDWDNYLQDWKSSSGDIRRLPLRIQRKLLQLQANKSVTGGSHGTNVAPSADIVITVDNVKHSFSVIFEFGDYDEFMVISLDEPFLMPTYFTFHGYACWCFIIDERLVMFSPSDVRDDQYLIHRPVDVYFDGNLICVLNRVSEAYADSGPEDTNSGLYGGSHPFCTHNCQHVRCEVLGQITIVDGKTYLMCPCCICKLTKIGPAKDRRALGLHPNDKAEMLEDIFAESLTSADSSVKASVGPVPIYSSSIASLMLNSSESCSLTTSPPVQSNTSTIRKNVLSSKLIGPVFPQPDFTISAAANSESSSVAVVAAPVKSVLRGHILSPEQHCELIFRYTECPFLKVETFIQTVDVIDSRTMRPLSFDTVKPVVAQFETVSVQYSGVSVPTLLKLLLLIMSWTTVLFIQNMPNSVVHLVANVIRSFFIHPSYIVSFVLFCFFGTPVTVLSIYYLLRHVSNTLSNSNFFLIIFKPFLIRYYPFIAIMGTSWGGTLINEVLSLEANSYTPLSLVLTLCYYAIFFFVSIRDIVLWSFYITGSITYVPHLLTCVSLEYAHGTNIDVVRSTAKGRILHLASFPISDSAALSFIDGTALAVEVYMNSLDFVGTGAIRVGASVVLSTLIIPNVRYTLVAIVCRKYPSLLKLCVTKLPLTYPLCVVIAAVFFVCCVLELYAVMLQFA